MSSLAGICLVAYGLVPTVSGDVLQALDVSGSVPHIEGFSEHSGISTVKYLFY